MTSSLIPLGDPELEQRIGRELDEVERLLIDATHDADPLVQAPSRHLMNAGGKRLRPVLVLLTSQLGSGVDDAVRQAAVAVELTHLATLYHDDVMDSAPLRRGAPSAHSVWGNSVAILTGDLLFARASRLVAALGQEAVQIQADAFERLVLGQLRETLGTSDGEDPIEHYLDVLADKTGSLIAAAAQFGAHFSGADEPSRRASVRYGEKVGVAFQLADDVIDLVSDSDATGKTPGTDLREGVATMPVLLLRARARAGTLDPEGAALLAHLDDDLSSDEVLADVLARLRRHDVLDEARDLASSWSDAAVAELAGLPDSRAKRALTAFASVVVSRLS